MANKPWERREDERETEKAYTAFLAYRNLPQGERTLRLACEANYGGSAAQARVNEWKAQPVKHHRVALLATVAMLAFAGNSLLCRLALKQTQIDAASFTLIRILGGAIVLALLMLLIRWRRNL